MNLHEYQAKELLKQYGVSVPLGFPASTVSEAVAAANKLKDNGTKIWAIKAQVHAGGRGKGIIYDADATNEVVLHGGVKVTGDMDKLKEYADKMLGNLIVTAQTGPAGRIIRKIYITEGVEAVKEFYLGIVLDRSQSRYVVMASTEGGVEIEKIAAEHPEKIIRETIDPKIGFRSFQAGRMGMKLGLQDDLLKQFVRFSLALAKAFETTDASVFEINPLVITKTNQVMALDCKIVIDDNALYRHPELEALRDRNEEDPLEAQAAEYHLNYVKLNGNVGCMVNGAGLAMATMDIIKLAGAEPANFLDVGGGANPVTVENGFRIILSDKNVRAILINIFGGIVRCDRIANGVLQAAKNIKIHVPLIVRLQGTNADQAMQILKKSGIPMKVATRLDEAAQMIHQSLRY